MNPDLEEHCTQPTFTENIHKEKYLPENVKTSTKKSEHDLESSEENLFGEDTNAMTQFLKYFLSEKFRSSVFISFHGSRVGNPPETNLWVKK